MLGLSDDKHQWLKRDNNRRDGNDEGIRTKRYEDQLQVMDRLIKDNIDRNEVLSKSMRVTTIVFLILMISEEEPEVLE